MIRQWNRVCRGEKEPPKEVFWRDLEEITSHARLAVRSATETGEKKDRRTQKKECARARLYARQGTRLARGKEKRQERVTILLSFLDVPQKSFSSLAAHPTMRVRSASSPFSITASSIFPASSARSFARSSVHQKSPGAQKAVKAIKVPESWARNEAR